MPIVPGPAGRPASEQDQGGTDPGGPGEHDDPGRDRRRGAVSQQHQDAPGRSHRESRQPHEPGMRGRQGRAGSAGSRRCPSAEGGRDQESDRHDRQQDVEGRGLILRHVEDLDSSDLGPGVPGEERAEDEGTAGEDESASPHPEIMSPRGEDQLREQDREHDHPDALIPQRPEEIDPVDTPDSAIVMAGGIDHRQRGQRGLLDDALLGDRQRHPEQQQADPAASPSPDPVTDHQRAATPGGDLWDQDEQDTDPGRPV